LNVSHSAAIIFHELYAGKADVKSYVSPKKDLMDALQTHFRLLMSKIRTPEHKRMLALVAFKNILARSFITQREASLLAGLFRRAALQLSDLYARNERIQETP